MPVHVLWTRFPLTARRLLDPFLFHNATASEEGGILSQLYLLSNFFIEAW